MEQMRLIKKKAFGASSEKSGEEILEQLSLLFNEPELQLSTESMEAAPVAGYTRKKRSGAVEEILPENVPVEVVEHRLPERELECPECGTLMTEIGKDVRRTLVMIPAQVSIREDWYFTYACQKYKQEGIETPILKAEKEPPVIPGSYASAEAIAHIAVLWWGSAVPAGAGMEPCRRHAQQAHVQLAHLGLGALADTDL